MSEPPQSGRFSGDHKWPLLGDRQGTSWRQLCRARLDPPGRVNRIDGKPGIRVRRRQQEPAAAVGDDICHGAEQRGDGEVRQPAARRIDAKLDAAGIR